MPNEKKDEEVYARISDSRRRDAGRGFARLDPLIQKKLDLHAGDGIELKNPVIPPICVPSSFIAGLTLKALKYVLSFKDHR